MREVNQRPVCHRAEDLVTYLYGEANDVEAFDFREHLQQCDACKSEFAGFKQVHESMLTWRQEALGASFNSAAAPAETAIDASRHVTDQRRLSALAAVREFFSVSPLWLRGATTFAGLLFCALVVLAISRSWQRAPEIARESGAPKIFTQAQFDAAVAQQVKNQTDKLQQAAAAAPKDSSKAVSPRHEVARAPKPAKPRIKGLTLEERQQLAADLRLVPSTEDDESLFVMSDQP